MTINDYNFNEEQLEKYNRIKTELVEWFSGFLRTNTKMVERDEYTKCFDFNFVVNMCWAKVEELVLCMLDADRQRSELDTKLKEINAKCTSYLSDETLSFLTCVKMSPSEETQRLFQLLEDSQYTVYNGDVAIENQASYIYELTMKLEDAEKATAKKFAKLVEFHSVATVDPEFGPQYTITKHGLDEILREDFKLKNEEIYDE